MAISRKIILSIYGGLMCLVLIFGAKITYSKDDVAKIIFLDVGQGDAILIQRADRQMLIDGGANGKIVMEKIGQYVPFWDRDIEIVVATHPDQDHIGGLIDVMENYGIEKLIDNGVLNQSKVSERFQTVSNQKNISQLEVSSGTKIKFGENISADILAPDGNQPKDDPKDTNSSSVVMRLSFGDKSFLLMGDATAESEARLMEENPDLSVDVLKIGHHGSKYSTSDGFLEKLKPDQAVISVGKNSYGHPAPEVLEKLEERKIEILRTDEKGDIIYECKDEKCFPVQ